MAKVTYNDLDGSAPRIEWLGHKFLDGQAVEVSDQAILAKAEGNPFFEVGRRARAVVDGEDESGGKAAPQTPFERGVLAATEDKTRRAPPAYSGKPEGDEWLAGFDSVKGTPPTPT